MSIKARRESALERLKFQLERGTKRNKKGTDYVELTEKDRKRIEKEISILEKRIKI